MKTRTPILLATLALAFAAAAVAQKPCTKADESAAMKAIDRISTWAALQSTWKSWRHCDQGPVGEQFTEAILRLVIDWKNVNQLADAMKDADYNAFILAHLKSPEAKGDAQDVYSRTKANCPRGLESFCKEMGEAVKEPPPPPPAALPEPMAPIRAPKATPAPPPAMAPQTPPPVEKK